MTKLNKIAVMALAMLTASVFADGVVITPVEPTGYQALPIEKSFSRGQTYRLVVYLKNEGVITTVKSKVFTGEFIGFGLIRRPSVPASRIYYEPNAGTVYAMFKGKHSTLLYRANIDWLIVQS